MVKKNHLIIILLVAAVGSGIFFFLYDTEEEKVKNVFYAISDSVEKKADENPIIGAGKAKQIREMLLDSCTVEIPSRGTVKTISSQEISTYTYARRTQFKTLSLKFYDISVKFPDKTHAKVTLTAVLKGMLTTQEQVEEVHELAVSLKKTEDNWRLSRIEIVEILEQ